MEDPEGQRLLRLRQGSVVWRELDDETVVLDVTSSKYFGTNGSGTVLWRAMAEGATWSQLVRALVDKYGIGEPEADSAVASFVTLCRERGFLDG